MTDYLRHSITISPVSTAAQGFVSSSKGLSVRFPRFIRCRDDKHVEDASTPPFLADIWRSQQTVGGRYADDGEILDIQWEELTTESEGTSD